MGRRKTTKRAAMADSEDPFACFAGADAAAPFRLPVSVVAWKGAATRGKSLPRRLVTASPAARRSVQ